LSSLVQSLLPYLQVSILVLTAQRCGHIGCMHVIPSITKVSETLMMILQSTKGFMLIPYIGPQAVGCKPHNLIPYKHGAAVLF